MAPDDPWTKCEDCGREAVRYVVAKPGTAEDQMKIVEIMDDMLSRKD